MFLILVSLSPNFEKVCIAAIFTLDGENVDLDSPMFVVSGLFVFSISFCTFRAFSRILSNLNIIYGE